MRLSKFTEKDLFRSLFFSKVAGTQLKKDFCNGVFLSVCQIVLFCKTPLGDYTFVLYIDLYQKMLPSVLVIIWLYLNIFKANNVNRLRTSVSGSPTQLTVD